jgi:hypothetical protein
MGEYRSCVNCMGPGLTVLRTVDIIMDFGGTAGQQGKNGLPDSHEFRVEGGKLRYVHTLSSCGGKACM